jgi:hypothetical protein
VTVDKLERLLLVNLFGRVYHLKVLRGAPLGLGPAFLAKLGWAEKACQEKYDLAYLQGDQIGRNFVNWAIFKAHGLVL